MAQFTKPYRAQMYMEVNERLIRRFWSKVDIKGGDDCWRWRGYVDRAGYGLLRIGSRIDNSRKTVLAHRLAYTIHEGPIEQPNILHKCDNRSCCNPRHLIAGTQLDNMRDAAAKGRISGQGKLQCIHGHDYTPENTIIAKTKEGTYRRCRICARESMRKYETKKSLAENEL